jgi:hypothetical protein
MCMLKRKDLISENDNDLNQNQVVKGWTNCFAQKYKSPTLIQRNAFRIPARNGMLQGLDSHRGGNVRETCEQSGAGMNSFSDNSTDVQ